MFGPKLTTWLSKSVEYIGTRANIFFIIISFFNNAKLISKFS